MKFLTKYLRTFLTPIELDYRLTPARFTLSDVVYDDPQLSGVDCLSSMRRMPVDHLVYDDIREGIISQEVDHVRTLVGRELRRVSL